MPDARPFVPQPKTLIAGGGFQPMILADQRCKNCGGTGKPKRHDVCKCVFRAVFLACLARYKRVDECGPNARYRVFSQEAEYRADFELIVTRMLGPDWAQWVCTEYMRRKDGQNWRAVGGSMKPREFFHRLHEIQMSVAPVLVDLGLFPPSEYVR